MRSFETQQYSRVCMSAYQKLPPMRLIAFQPSYSLNPNRLRHLQFLMLTIYSTNIRCGEKNDTRKMSRSRKISKWLASHKGYFVCGMNNMATRFRSRSQVRDAVNKLKYKYPNAMITIDDIIMLTVDIMSYEEEEVSTKTGWCIVFGINLTMVFFESLFGLQHRCGIRYRNVQVTYNRCAHSTWLI